MLQTIVENQLWTWDEPFTIGGLDIGARMTIARLPDGGLWVHSPLAPSEPLRQALSALGPVRYVVVPNTAHYLGVADFAEDYPEAKIHVAPGIAESKKQIPYHAVLSDAPEAEWSETLDQMIFRGNPLTEVIFFHRASRTLILTDTCHYLTEGNLLTQIYAKTSNVQDKPGPTLILKAITLNHQAARESLERLMQWDFDRVIVSHGSIYESGGKEALREKFTWLAPESKKTLYAVAFGIVGVACGLAVARRARS